MIEIKGKAGIIVKILADSISRAGVRLISYELTYPRIVHAELLTHGMLVRNAASSRAIPFAKMQEQLTARPVRFGQANPGMQDKGEDYTALVKGSWGEGKVSPDVAWSDYRDQAMIASQRFYEAGYHKQVYNRLTEPFQMMKVVLSGTELENFFWLRNHGAADPTLEELAKCMHEAREQSKPELLEAGEWHLPYVNIAIRHDGKRCYMIEESGDWDELSKEEAIKVSAARCAAVSFRNEDYTLEKCLEVYERLVGDERKHASAFQHQATPMHPKSKWIDFGTEYGLNNPNNVNTWEPGISHVDRNGQLWSAQFKGWIMFRKTITGENYNG